MVRFASRSAAEGSEKAIRGMVGNCRKANAANQRTALVNEWKWKRNGGGRKNGRKRAKSARKEGV